MSVIESRVEDRRRDCSLPVDMRLAFASSPQSGLTWSCFLFLLAHRATWTLFLAYGSAPITCNAEVNC
jgi:hypothetical protein